MRSELAIETENLSKRYFVADHTRRGASQRELMLRGLSSPYRRLTAVLGGRSAFGSETDLWALKDVSIQVKKGDVVGIIGTNGSGKSTLLKILSRVTAPTEGIARIYGDVGSLLEVGTGFHPDLTGRENVFLSGAILGMSRREIVSVFDEIVDFSGVEAFIDTPVKRYSSGMRVRLAFAVAAFLRPEILMIDEVLAVGDAAFQRRGLSKVSSVAQQGRTVLMVTHNMSAILSNATWVMWLDKGRLVEVGEPQTVIAHYLKESTIDVAQMENEKYFTSAAHQRPEIPFELVAMRTLDQQGDLCASFLSSAPIIVEMEFKLKAEISGLRVGFEVKTSDDMLLFRSLHNDAGEVFAYDPSTENYRLRASIPGGLFNNGTYAIDPWVYVHPNMPLVSNVRGLLATVVLDSVNKGFMGRKGRAGLIAPLLEWSPIREKV